MSTLASCSGEHIAVWSLETESKTASFAPHTKRITSIQWNHNNEFLASSSEDGTIAIQYPDGALLHRLSPPRAYSDEIRCIALSSGSNLLASGGTEKYVRVWDVKSRACVQELKGHVDPVTAVAFNTSSSHIVSGNSVGGLLLHSLTTHGVVATLGDSSSADQAITDVSYSPFRRSIVASSSDSGAVSLWDINKRSLLQTFQHKAPASGISFSPVNALLMCSAGLDKKLVFYDVKELKLVKCLSLQTPLSCVSFMEDGVHVAVGTSDGSIMVYDIRSGSSPTHFFEHAHSHSVSAVRFHRLIKKDKNGVGVESSGQKKMSLEPTLTDARVAQKERILSSNMSSVPSNPNPHSESSASSSRVPVTNDMSLFSPLREVPVSRGREERSLENSLFSPASLSSQWSYDRDISHSNVSDPFGSQFPSSNQVKSSVHASKPDSALGAADLEFRKQSFSPKKQSGDVNREFNLKNDDGTRTSSKLASSGVYGDLFSPVVSSRKKFSSSSPPHNMHETSLSYSPSSNNDKLAMMSQSDRAFEHSHTQSEKYVRTSTDDLLLDKKPADYSRFAVRSPSKYPTNDLHEQGQERTSFDEVDQRAALNEEPSIFMQAASTVMDSFSAKETATTRSDDLVLPSLQGNQRERSETRLPVQASESKQSKARMDGTSLMETSSEQGLLQSVIRQELEDVHLSLHEDNQSLQIELIRQFHLQEMRMMQGFQAILSGMQKLQSDVDNLRTDVERLKLTRL